MPILTVFQGKTEHHIPFQGKPTVGEVLIQAGILTPHPCGGKGRCGKCAITATGALSPLTEAEQRLNTRLSCMTALQGDATVILPDQSGEMHIETDTAALAPTAAAGFGAAVDIGTTTVAVKLYDLSTGECLGAGAAPNPQAAVAADVMGRMDAAMHGHAASLQQMISDTVRSLLCQASPNGKLPDSLQTVITGNTTMLYLLCGHDTTPLSRAPFRADHLFGTDTPLPFLPSPAYLPPCMNAFVGADITCAVLASGMCDRAESALLCDIGTNGELALWKNGILYVTSTAAGPAFEGAGIVCGCGSIPGAVDRVWVEEGQLRIHTIADAAPVGLCGSGVIDAVAAGLVIAAIDESGAMEEEMPLSPDGIVALHPQDVRAVQLAKAAIAAGIDTLLEISHTVPEEIAALYIAGGFGSHLDLAHAADIGLLPRELICRAVILGNAALSGAAMSLTAPAARDRLAQIASLSQHVNLGGDPRFSHHYIDRMIFGDDEM